MADHPIQGLMKTTMENLKHMVDVNTIIGDPVETPDGCVVDERYHANKAVLNPETLGTYREVRYT